MLKLQGDKPRKIIKQEKEEEKPIMKKFTMLLVLAMVLSLTVGIAVAMAAPGNYDDATDYPAGQSPADAVSAIGTNLETGEVTPADADGTYTGTNAHQSNTVTAGTYGQSEDVINRAKSDGVNDDLYIHGQFKKATNACASCHVTHTAAGDKLLIQNGIYNTCTACHDGTLGKLSVFDMPGDADFDVTNVLGWDNIGGGSFGGAFNAAENASMHMPTGALEVAAAPGGNRQAQGTDLLGNVVDTASWTAEFTCASCHQPHGSASDRLLTNNPANIGRLDVQIYDWADSDSDGVWNAVYDVTGDGVDASDTVLTGPWARGEAYRHGETQTVVFKAIYAADVQAMLDGQAPSDPDTKDFVYGQTISLLADDYQAHEFAVNYIDAYGQLKSTETAAGPYKIAIVPAVVAKVLEGEFVADGDISNNNLTIADGTVTSLGDHNGEGYIQGLDGQITKWTGSQQAITNPKSDYDLTGITWFCAGCHTDYYADKFEDPENTGAALEGRYTTAYRHTINRGALGSDPASQQFVWESGYSHGNPGDTLTCLSCHYAHGTSQQIMRNADDTKALAADVNPSSALKRYVNMAVCWKCHIDNHNGTFLHDEGYYSADTQAIQASNGSELVPTN